MQGGWVAPQKSLSKKKWLIIAIVAALVVAIITTVIIIIVNSNAKPQTENPDPSNQPTAETNDESNKIDSIIVDTEFQAYNLDEAAAYAYLGEQIQKYDNDNDVKPRLIIVKAYMALKADNKNKAIEIANTINEDSLNNTQKLLFYNLMQDIYDREEEKYLEYYKKYYQLYDEMFDYVGDGEEENE